MMSAGMRIGVTLVALSMGVAKNRALYARERGLACGRRIPDDEQGLEDHFGPM
jgi:hypothetical protein